MTDFEISIKKFQEFLSYDAKRLKKDNTWRQKDNTRKSSDRMDVLHITPYMFPFLALRYNSNIFLVIY